MDRRTDGQTDKQIDRQTGGLAVPVEWDKSTNQPTYQLANKLAEQLSNNELTN